MNYIYLKKFLVEFINDNHTKGYNKFQLMQKFINLYREIKLDYSNITDEFKKILIKKKINKIIQLNLKIYIISNIFLHKVTIIYIIIIILKELSKIYY